MIADPLQLLLILFRFFNSISVHTLLNQPRFRPHPPVVIKSLIIAFFVFTADQINGVRSTHDVLKMSTEKTTVVENITRWTGFEGKYKI